MESTKVKDSDVTATQFGHVLDMVPAAAYTCDRDGLITYFNRQAVQLWGRAPKLNDPVDRFCGSFKLYASDGTPIQHDQCWMAKALSEGRPHEGKEIVIEREDGTRIRVLAHANPICDANGKVVGAVNILIDITTRAAAESDQRLLAAIVESSDDAIVSKSLDGTILSWNTGAERLFGYSAAEAIGSSILMIIPVERHPEEHEILAKIRRGERIEHFETVRRTKDGREIDISLTISPVRNAAGQVVGISKVARDITSRKRSENALKALTQEYAEMCRQLRESEQRKDEFIAMLAHELRNPLAPICNAIQILRLSDDLNPAAERVCEIMERQVNHIVRLVDDLLDATRIARGKIELRKEHVDLVSIVRNAVETIRPLIEEAGHQLAITLTPEPIMVDGDPVRITQVLSNLLTNAVKYTVDGGQIWLTLRRDEDRAVISVRDNGMGIPTEMLPAVFDMFTQVDRTLKRSRGGLGIGLTLAKKLVQLHGGEIEVRSDGIGKGSEFIVRLPLGVSVTRHPVPQGARTMQKASTPRRVLVVDDTHAGVITLSKLLEKMGQVVRTAHDARSALEKVREERPDVVISDIAMPHTSGYELAAQIRQEPDLEDIVLVALTGYGRESDKQRAIDAGFDFHLVKPVSVAVLREIFDSLPEPPKQLPRPKRAPR